jgi:hypothetical protein
MHASHHPIENSLYGAMMTTLLGFAGTGLAQEEAIADYNRYLDNRTVEIATYPKPDSQQAAVIRDLELRINCLELTRMPCEGKGKGVALEGDPMDTQAPVPTTSAAGGLGAQPQVRPSSR